MTQLSINEIAAWFKNHRVTIHEIMGTEMGRLEILRWQRPGSWTYGIDYVLKAGALCVIGDLGEAIYQWYGPVDGLKWIAGLSIDYFHGKCMASEDGRSMKNYEWDEDEARKYIFEYFRSNRDCKGYQRFEDAGIDLSSQFALQAWCHENDPSEIFDDQDWWEWLPSCGQVMPIRTRAHLIGLKLIFDKELKYC